MFENRSTCTTPAVDLDDTAQPPPRLSMILSEEAPAPPDPVPAAAGTDAGLLEAARNMDREALVRIFDLYSTPLYNYALRLCQDPLLADHIVGDVFARFLDRLAAGQGPETNLRSYLYSMAHHLVVDEVRYAGRRAPLEASEPYYYGEPASLPVERRLLLDKVMHAIRTALTADQRHVIVLRFLEGMNVRETARIMGKREDHVKVLQSRAIKSLRKLLPA